MPLNWYGKTEPLYARIEPLYDNTEPLSAIPDP